MNRLDKLRAVRAALRSDKPSIGSWIQIPDPSIAEIMGAAGYDWVAVDLEHGAVGVDQLPNLFRALELGGTLPLARLAQGQVKDCKQALDAGAGGVVVPMVESAEQLDRVCAACRWPPAGTRGVGFSRANLFGKRFDAYAEEAQAPLIVAMIEHERAVARLEEILRVPGLDAILVGPYDLSASMGITAQFDHARFEAAMQRILVGARANGIACGVHVVEPDPAALERRIDQGYRFVAYSLDSVFLRRAAERPPLGGAPADKP
jgi:2-dehydro-3-deoxyglucarate aldolase